MSIPITIAGIIPGIIVLLLQIALFVKKEYSIQSSVLISRPVTEYSIMYGYSVTRCITTNGISTSACKT